MFSNSRKLAQQTSQRLIAGHFTLTAWWALKHAGVFDAMLKLESEKKEGGGGMVPLVHAARTSMAPEVLSALFDYLATTGLVAFTGEGGEQVRFTPEGKALLEHEDPVLELVHAYEPTLESAEHLLARLKPTGSTGYRKSDAYIDSQARRYAPEMFPAVLSMLAKQGCTHLLDLSCGAGDLLMYLAKSNKNIVGVGIGMDGAAVRRANRAIAANGGGALEKRLIAVAANPLDICTDTRRVFDRIGISKQLWDEIDCLVAPCLFSELALKDADSTAAVVKALAAIPKNFPNAHLLLIEPVASALFDRNYYAPELALLLRLSNSAPWRAEKWRDILRQSRLRLLQETPLTTDGLALFLCKSA